MIDDSPELEALFDSIALTTEPEPAKAAPKIEVADTPELETLFDSIALAVSREGGEGEEGHCPERVFSQLGQMTRGLHNLLRELGYDKALGQIAQDMPNNRDRLNYIAAMTAQAAERTLNAAEAAQPFQEKLGAGARDLSGKWDRLFDKKLGVDEFKALVHDTRAYLKEAPAQAEATNAQLMEIIMAQDFQDLTGQVIKRILEAAQNLESQLLSLLIETTPEGVRQSVDPGLLNGPVINSSGRNDVVTSQEQVDDLLESLGF
ncbi:MAG: protein phosphatase CheZ [Gallionellaceae bacterium]|nr:protein phosphatase CheZ [Gallionellaceae bacterium]